MLRFLMKLWFLIGVPFSIVLILGSAQIHPAYKMGWLARTRLGLKMFINQIRIETATTYKAHLAMALKLLEMPPEIAGDVVECGCYKGGSSTNLSLVCQIVGRKLLVYDSFAGLPPGDALDREAEHYEEGDFCGTLDEVKTNIRRGGAIECCEFIEGWFQDTLPGQTSPVVLAFLDVDLEASLDVCVRHLWPRLVDTGYVFTDECVTVDYVALFYSERWWRENFDRTPPGLIGAGTGLPLGEFYIGPYEDRDYHRGQHLSTGAYTRKDFSGYWTYYPERA